MCQKINYSFISYNPHAPPSKKGVISVKSGEAKAEVLGVATTPHSAQQTTGLHPPPSARKACSPSTTLPLQKAFERQTERERDLIQFKHL